MNDSRNDTEYRCEIQHAMTTLITSDPTLLYVAGEYLQKIVFTIMYLLHS